MRLKAKAPVGERTAGDALQTLYRGRGRDDGAAAR
jgi:hypothetical protein